MRRKTRSISLKECYVILNVDSNATLEDVKHAYRRKAFELHPDLNPDDPHAGKNFQLLNEAYVALSAVLQQREGQANEDSGNPGQNEQEEKKEERTEERQEEENGKEGEEDGRERTKEEKQRRQADKAYAEQDVLRDLLNDPFARRVFEDIYSELNKQQAGRKEKTQSERPRPENSTKKEEPAHERPKQSQTKTRTERPQTTLHKGNIAWDTPKWDNNKGVGGYVKNWFRRQIDEELTLTLPAANLTPGRKVRLQIRHGLSNDIHTIEVTLPPDFTPGKPIRLRKLGRRVGPWQGDLYLTIESS
ncbi:MAG: DnaJ domain-containing protein [Desulfovibrio sp.]|nr:DnaJ domain-containing protein [Desulfovibrio sp.]